jgi:hypothetical protein
VAPRLSQSRAGGVLSRWGTIKVNVDFDRPPEGQLRLQVRVVFALLAPPDTVHPECSPIRPPPGLLARAGASSPAAPQFDCKADVHAYPLSDYNDAARGSKVGLTFTTTQTITGPQTPWVQFHVEGLDGIGFGESRTRVEARFPSVLDDASEAADSQADEKIAVETGYFIKDGGDLTWSGVAPTILGGQGTPFWDYDVGGPTNLEPPNAASAVRDDLLAKNSQQTFIAGALIGVGGGAAVPAVQNILRTLVLGIALLRSRRAQPARS